MSRANSMFLSFLLFNDGKKAVSFPKMQYFRDIVIRAEKIHVWEFYFKCEEG